MKKEGGLIETVRSNAGGYYIRITRQDYRGQASDEYKATVTRISDDVQMSFFSDWKWWLGWKIRPWALDRAFKQYDKRQKKLAKVEERVI